jgi:outer membrane protein insertion porin family
MRMIRSIFVALLVLLVSGSAIFGAENSKRYRVGRVKFDGNTVYSRGQLISLMLTHPSGFFSKSYYYPEVFNDDLDNIVAFYRQNGYLQAEISDTNIVFDSLNRRVNIAIAISEGEQTLVDAISMFGNLAMPDTTLWKQVKFKIDEPLRRRAIQESVNNLLAVYAEHGYLDAGITPNVKINAEAHRAVVDFMIQEGHQSDIDSIRIEGNNRTHRSVIKRELLFKPGQTIRYSKLLETQRRLYLTGLFESAFVRPVAAASGDSLNKDILIELKEQKSSEFGFLVGYGSIEKIRGRIEISTLNLSGTARQAGASAEANFIKQSLAASFSEPWTLGTRWRTDLNLSLDFKQEPGYDQRSLGGRLTIGRRLKTYTNISGAYRIENSDITNISADIVQPETRTRIRSLTFSVIHDSRDNLFNPSRGKYIEWSNELAGSFLQGSNTFGKTIFRFKTFLSLGRETVLASAIEIGILDYMGTGQDIPLQERFYAGGPTSVRSFGYQRLGPHDIDGTPIGGNFKLILNIFEIRQTIYKLFGGAVFVDLGNVWSQTRQFHLADMRSAVGGGFRFSSPLGLIRIDYGYNIDRQAGEPAGKLFLGIGQAF